METLLGFTRAQLALHIGELSEVAAARRAAQQLAKRLGFGETEVGRVALVVTEAATNIAKHAASGEIVLQAVSRGEVAGIEILALDRGPGMTDFQQSLADGTSSVGTYGIGLGAMQRQSNEFDVYSVTGHGTAVRMVLWATPPEHDARKPALEIGAVSIAYPGETVCGDGWMVSFDEQAARFMVCDGLGHGPDAALASTEATRRAAGSDYPPAVVIEHLHQALRSTRGAAVAVAELDRSAGEIHFAGVGNIAASVITDDQRYQLVSHNGIVGGKLLKVQTFSAKWERGSLFVAHSDGLSTRWSLDDYPGLARCHPGLVAAVLYRDFGRQRDDMTVLAIREVQG